MSRDDQTPARGSLRPHEQSPYDPNQPLPSAYMDRVLAHMDALYRNLIAPDGRLARLERDLGAVKTLLQFYVCAHQLESTPHSQHSPNLRVLLVEDDKLLQTVLVRVLQRYGMCTLTASSAEEARAVLQRETMDVAVVDLRLGLESGFELAAWILQCSAETRVLLVSGMVTEEDEEQATALHLAILAKPFDNQKLIASILEAHGARATPPAAG